MTEMKYPETIDVIAMISWIILAAGCTAGFVLTHSAYIAAFSVFGLLGFGFSSTITICKAIQSSQKGERE